MTALTSCQRRFVALHQRQADPPFKWHWMFQESMLCVSTERGEIATISAIEFDDLVERGIMRRDEFGAVLMGAPSIVPEQLEGDAA